MNESAAVAEASPKLGAKELFLRTARATLGATLVGLVAAALDARWAAAQAGEGFGRVFTGDAPSELREERRGGHHADAVSPGVTLPGGAAGAPEQDDHPEGHED